MMKFFRVNRSGEHGFTLMELLAVVGVIAVLAAIAVPIFSAQRGRAQDAKVSSDVRSIAQALDSRIETVNSKRVIPNYTQLVNDGVSSSTGVQWGVSSNPDGSYCVVGFSPDGKDHKTRATAVVYSSDAGYGKQGAGCKNEGNPGEETYVGSSTTVPATPYTDYKCNDGETLANGNTCTTPAYTYTARSYSQYAGETYYCGGWDSLSGTTCYGSTTQSYSASLSYGDCPAWAPVSPIRYGECATSYAEPSKNPYTGVNSYNNCYNGDEKYGSRCYSGFQRPQNYSCSWGDSLSGSTCYRTVSTSYRAYSYSNYTTGYACDTGAGVIRNGTSCNVPTAIRTADTFTNYKCASSAWSFDSSKKLCTRQDSSV